MNWNSWCRRYNLDVMQRRVKDMVKSIYAHGNTKWRTSCIDLKAVISQSFKLAKTRKPKLKKVAILYRSFPVFIGNLSSAPPWRRQTQSLLHRLSDWDNYTLAREMFLSRAIAAWREKPPSTRDIIFSFILPIRPAIIILLKGIHLTPEHSWDLKSNAYILLLVC